MLKIASKREFSVDVNSLTYHYLSSFSLCKIVGNTEQNSQTILASLSFPNCRQTTKNEEDEQQKHPRHFVLPTDTYFHDDGFKGDLTCQSLSIS